jgi:hypothetical protein
LSLNLCLFARASSDFATVSDASASQGSKLDKAVPTNTRAVYQGSI